MPPCDCRGSFLNSSAHADPKTGVLSCMDVGSQPLVDRRTSDIIEGVRHPHDLGESRFCGEGEDAVKHVGMRESPGEHPCHLISFEG